MDMKTDILIIDCTCYLWCGNEEATGIPNVYAENTVLNGFYISFP